MRARTLALIAALALPSSVAAATAKQPPLHTDAADTPASGLDLTGARFGQVGNQLSLQLTTAEGWKVSDLTPGKGRSLCVLLFAADGNTRVCVMPGADGTSLKLRWSRLNTAGHPEVSRDVIGATVTRADSHTVQATFTADHAYLKPGTVRWQASSHWGSSADLLPDGGSVPLKLTPPDPGVPVGCQANPAQVELRGISTTKKEVALTFDDGPGPLTAQFTALLRKYKVNATFFIVGKEVAGRQALLRQSLKDGNLLANHSWNHADLGGGGPAATSQITSTNAAIKKATGFTPCLFRPPYGSTGPSLRADVTAQHMTSILWDVDPTDWARPGADAIVSRVLSNVHNGGIVISHDGGGDRSQTLAAYQTIIPTLIQRGYKLVTVAQLLGLNMVYKDGSTRPAGQPLTAG